MEVQKNFKRPHITQERKKAQNVSEPPASYHPFSSTSEDDNSSKSPLPPSEKEKTDGSGRSISFLYQQIVEKDKDVDKKQNPQPREKPKSGYTIYVSGKSITENYLKKHFSEFGSIVNISMEIEKGKNLKICQELVRIKKIFNLN